MWASSEICPSLPHREDFPRTDCCAAFLLFWSGVRTEKGQQALNGFVQLVAELLHLLPHEEALSLSCVRTLEVYVHPRINRHLRVQKGVSQTLANEDIKKKKQEALGCSLDFNGRMTVMKRRRLGLSICSH